MFIWLSGCDRMFTGPFGTVASPNLQGESTSSTYDNDLTCTYDIRLSDNSKGIKLIWDTFDVKGIMPTCAPKDYVEIFMGCGRRHSIGKYCSDNSASTTLLFDVYSPDNCLRIEFHSDDSDAGRGFKASYISIDMNSGMFTSRLFGSLNAWSCKLPCIWCQNCSLI